MSLHPQDTASQPGTGHGKAFGTFGELLQGVLFENDLDFLVTLPIERFARATYESLPEHGALTVEPTFKKKAQKMARLITDHFDLPAGGHLTIQSDIPVGKGLASSSADLVATARAVADCFGLELPCELLQRFLLEIEPTDGVMYPGVVSFYHRKVELCEFLGSLPPLTIVSIDEGGEVDTVEFNKLPKPFSTEEKQEYSRLLDQISSAMRERDTRQIGEVATASALLNQKLRPKRMLPDFIELCDELDALGVVVAHSGTCIGLLLAEEDPRYDKQLQLATERLRLRAEEVTVYRSWRNAPDAATMELSDLTDNNAFAK